MAGEANRALAETLTPLEQESEAADSGIEVGSVALVPNPALGELGLKSEVIVDSPQTGGTLISIDEFRQASHSAVKIPVSTRKDSAPEEQAHSTITAQTKRVLDHRPDEDIDTLFERTANGDFRAKEELCKRFLPLAHRLALTYVTHPQYIDDLQQVASIGLLNAISRFDRNRGTEFISFAAPTIIGEIKRHFRNYGWDTHVPRRLQDNALAVIRIREDFQATGQECTPQKVAETLGISYEEATEAWLTGEKGKKIDSLERPVGPHDDEGTVQTLHDSISGSWDEERIVDHVALKIEIDKMLEGVFLRDRWIFEHHVLLDQTQSDTAELFGVNQMYVSRVAKRIRKDHPDNPFSEAEPSTTS